MMQPIQIATKMPPPIAVTMRLPEGLKAEADAYAEGLGISLNALLAVSLREYLNGQRSSATQPSVAPVTPDLGQRLPPPGPPGYVEPAETVTKPATPAATSGPRIKPPNSRSDPCPCGAKDHLGYRRLKYKECHGRVEK